MGGKVLGEPPLDENLAHLLISYTLFTQDLQELVTKGQKNPHNKIN